jgi:hypothetical protein
MLSQSGRAARGRRPDKIRPPSFQWLIGDQCRLASILIEALYRTESIEFVPMEYQAETALAVMAAAQLFTLHGPVLRVFEALFPDARFAPAP